MTGLAKLVGVGAVLLTAVVMGSPAPATGLLLARDNDLSSCTNRTFARGYLRARCSQDTCSEIHMNGCLDNQDGHLTPNSNGGYDYSCRDCALRKDIEDPLFECDCQEGDTGYYMHTSLNLDTVIRANNDSVLFCYGKVGSTVTC
ncbi:Uu.00g054810.m01.CDS01 [Anthostomella pinea]|uniref:Uu.00g054810.m01.CDS01 n=1 Tax=Anthostomella pinea TaxID=933095 RepID=A0AAI8VWQ0_9PEZI|nr:Uu.00g054810.m01.CDS01 [Anthostomella pinea]